MVGAREPVLGGRLQMLHVENEIQSQVLRIGSWTPVSMPVDPDPDVVRKSLEKFDEVGWHRGRRRLRG